MFFADTEVKNAKDRESLEKMYIKALDKPLDDDGEVTWVEFGKDVELLPLKALRYMQQAELVLFAKSCPFDFIDLCRRDAERERFTSAAELSERLKKAKAEQLRVCVLIHHGMQEYTLLQAHQRVLGQGFEK